MGLKIIFPKWREVESRTFTKAGVIYLGLNTIKGFGNSVAPALKEIATESKSFMDVIIHCKQSGVISETQIETLIIHDFFSEFGDRDKLLAVYGIFKKVYGRKQFNKDGDLPVNADILAKFSKETAKQYREVRTDELMEYLVENSAVHKLSLQAVLAAELRDFGYINYQDPNLEKTFYVTDVNTKYSPKISFYNMKNGMVFEAKVNKKYFCNNPLCVGNIIKGDFTVKPKTTKQGEEFVIVPNTREFWAKNYTVI
jgi:DNA polymerase-3 subunit alpha